ncbi:MAG: class I SAM-dependent methyltransferase [Lentisphaeraceae bacterium]|nr:class I SAM-dependent methyltransferase [Lentisphaeraceae bacterium]
MTKNSKKQIDFSAIAPVYDLLGALFFGGKLHNSQLENLKNIPSKFKHILVIGGGTGKFLKELVASKQFEKLTYIDISPKMIDLAKSKVPDTKNIDFIVGDETTIPDHSFDLIVTHYFLDCFDQTEFEKIADLLLSQLCAGGYWSMVDFYIHPKSTWIRKVFVRFLYKFFKLTCRLETKELPDFDLWFSKNLILKKDVSSCKKLLKSSVYQKSS